MSEWEQSPASKRQTEPSEKYENLKRPNDPQQYFFSSAFLSLRAVCARTQYEGLKD